MRKLLMRQRVGRGPELLSSQPAIFNKMGPVIAAFGGQCAESEQRKEPEASCRASALPRSQNLVVLLP